jgi:hypothetical protein
MNILNWIVNNWKQITEAATAIGGDVLAFYYFVCKHGGYRTMWAEFQGPKQPTVAQPNIVPIVAPLPPKPVTNNQSNI